MTEQEIEVELQDVQRAALITMLGRMLVVDRHRLTKDKLVKVAAEKLSAMTVEEQAKFLRAAKFRTQHLNAIRRARS